jgi:hypothetical protein
MTAPLTFDQFSESEYFENFSQIPNLLVCWWEHDINAILESSLMGILQLEAKKTEQNKRNLAAKTVYIDILDNQLPTWLTNLGVTDLPAKSKAVVTLCNNIVSAYETHKDESGVPLETVELAAFDSFLRKLTLCLPTNANRVYKTESYDRSTVVYCGHCDDIVSARNPMSLELAAKHFAFYHRDSLWKQGMLRQAPAGQPVFDGTCRTCRNPVLVELTPTETKSGVQCLDCGGRWCFNCMDPKVWLGPDPWRVGVISKGSPWFTALTRQFARQRIFVPVVACRQMLLVIRGVLLIASCFFSDSLPKQSSVETISLPTSFRLL